MFNNWLSFHAFVILFLDILNSYGFNLAQYKPWSINLYAYSKEAKYYWHSESMQELSWVRGDLFKIFGIIKPSNIPSQHGKCAAWCHYIRFDRELHLCCNISHQGQVCIISIKPHPIDFLFYGIALFFFIFDFLYCKSTALLGAICLLVIRSFDFKIIATGNVSSTCPKNSFDWW